MGVSDTPSDSQVPAVVEVSRYDLFLMLLPIPLLLGAGGGMAATVPVSLGIASGSIIATLLLVYALFVDAPVPGDGS